METRDTAMTVRRFVNKLEYGALFTTRDCLNFGPRAAIDQELYRLVKEGSLIRRVARGVFQKWRPGIRPPTILEVAQVKAKAFGRTTWIHAQKILEQVKIVGESSKVILATNGSTSSFLCGKTRIHFHRCAPRKVTLENTKHGLVIRGLWFVGEGAVTEKVLRKATAGLNRNDWTEIRKSCGIMPSWLADELVFQFAH